MYEELASILLYDAGWLEQGTTQTERNIAEHLKKAADAIEELSKRLNCVTTERDAAINGLRR